MGQGPTSTLTTTNRAHLSRHQNLTSTSKIHMMASTPIGMLTRRRSARNRVSVSPFVYLSVILTLLSTTLTICLLLSNLHHLHLVPSSTIWFCNFLDAVSPRSRQLVIMSSCKAMCGLYGTAAYQTYNCTIVLRVYTACLPQICLAKELICYNASY